MTLHLRTTEQTRISGLPVGLPDHVYASWTAALRRLKSSKTFREGENSYEFCLGYIQAFQDAQVVDERICSFLLLQLHAVRQEISDDLFFELSR